MKIREWKNITYLLLFSSSSEGGKYLACIQLYTQIIHQLVCCCQDANMYPVYQLSQVTEISKLPNP